jgi:acetoin utilization protein AcuB
MIVRQVKDVMSADVVTIGPEASLAAAALLLEQHAIRHLPVVDASRLVGIVSDRDVRSAAGASALDRLTVREAMTPQVITVSPATPVEDAAKLMLAHRVGGLPVVSHGELCGIVTETDLLAAFVDLMELDTLERIALDYPDR